MALSFPIFIISCVEIKVEAVQDYEENCQIKKSLTGSDGTFHHSARDKLVRVYREKAESKVFRRTVFENFLVEISL